MIRFKSITDEILYHILKSDIYKYLELSTMNRLKQSYSSKDLSEFLRFNEYNKIVLEFIEKFIKSFSKNQTEAMLYRLKSLEISNIIYKVPSSIYYCISLGYYDRDNKIKLEYYQDRRASKESIKETLIHELLHMASTKELEDGTLSGFELPYLLGLSLNEGYTEYLTEKYFTKGMEYVKSNNVDIFFAKGIENIIGPKKMQEFYFNADLNGLINELSQYSTKEEIIRLIFSIDRQKRMLTGSKQQAGIIKEIATINARKLKSDLETGLITYEQYQIEYAKNVSEYLKGNLWSEETQVIKDNGTFILCDQGFTSSLYELKERTNPKNKVKYYQ